MYCILFNENENYNKSKYSIINYFKNNYKIKRDKIKIKHLIDGLKRIHSNYDKKIIDDIIKKVKKDDTKKERIKYIKITDFFNIFYDEKKKLLELCILQYNEMKNYSIRIEHFKKSFNFYENKRYIYEEKGILKINIKSIELIEKYIPEEIIYYRIMFRVLEKYDDIKFLVSGKKNKKIFFNKKMEFLIKDKIEYMYINISKKNIRKKEKYNIKIKLPLIFLCDQRKHSMKIKVHHLLLSEINATFQYIFSRKKLYDDILKEYECIKNKQIERIINYEKEVLKYQLHFISSDNDITTNLKDPNIYFSYFYFYLKNIFDNKYLCDYNLTIFLYIGILLSALSSFQRPLFIDHINLSISAFYNLKNILFNLKSKKRNIHQNLLLIKKKRKKKKKNYTNIFHSNNFFKNEKQYKHIFILLIISFIYDIIWFNDYFMCITLDFLENIQCICMIFNIFFILWKILYFINLFKYFVEYKILYN
ncbi:hypothetical protein PGAL8A_00300700 [Plasmodium gallinaceum]|uniref:Uncharacterized protein n=1 Tax=Plasmodium gallinaceum TaxID=5849 RepID=A0A1J1GU76_PLAGA|nr:hypothetical protein PGAL8A_00300700 [Plasmodium gallinaceum]CRG95795.1 hypothetical protein PGAL8A_00300700 [Plasmodium gallinaceum]